MDFLILHDIFYKLAIFLCVSIFLFIIIAIITKPNNKKLDKTLDEFIKNKIGNEGETLINFLNKKGITTISKESFSKPIIKDYFVLKLAIFNFDDPMYIFVGIFGKWFNF